MLTDSERAQLLSVARAAVGAAARREKKIHLPAARGALGQPRGAFVTLRIGGELRGCIGYVEATDPLLEVVARAATKAAREDPRFEPVSAAEVEHLEIEISAMSRVTPLPDPADIRLGVHGLIIELGGNRGLLLPQVPLEYGWTREEFLSHTARKAGLPASAWRDPLAKLFWFEAEVFDEHGVHDAG
jgi:uncharacterized protein